MDSTALSPDKVECATLSRDEATGKVRRRVAGGGRWWRVVRVAVRVAVRQRLGARGYGEGSSPPPLPFP